jgi:tetracycline 7-halogenase / FADH2 O2-dependent halogenase
MDDGFADPGDKYDVAILGSHLGSCLLAAILARHGVRVLLVDGAQDTTQVCGETTVPYTAEVFFTLAKRFDMPEIGALGLTCDLPDEIRATSGIKRSLGFLYHERDTEQDPRHAIQFNVPGEHSEWHPYRPDVDQHIRRIAIARGARTIRYRPTVRDVHIGRAEVHVLTTDDVRYRARYIVDALGPDSPLPPRLATADAVRAPVLRHRSRVIAAHLRGVTEFERCVDQSRYRRATPWSRGTLSHVFPGGWLQVVHFGNHEGGGRNPLCGVTLSLDPDRFADLPDDPDVAFHRVIERFPSLHRSFAAAIPVTPWTHEPHWQFAAPTAAVDRAFVFERSASRNDMFLSRDVTMSAELVHALAPVLIDAARTDDWSARRFAAVAGFQAELIELNDRFFVAARTSAADFALWNAFTRVWLLWSILAALSLKRARHGCLASGDWADVTRLADGPWWFALPTGVPEFLAEVFALIEAVDRGEVSARTAADRIFARLRKSRFVPPLYRFGDADDRYYHFTMAKRLRMLLWSKTSAPPEFRAMLTRENVTSVPPSATPAGIR